MHGDSKINLLISIEKPEGPEPEPRKPTLYEKVKYAVDCLQGDYNTQRATHFLARVYEEICKCEPEQLTPMKKKIMRMIVPELEFFMPQVLDSKHYVQYLGTRDLSESPKASKNYKKVR